MLPSLETALTGAKILCGKTALITGGGSGIGFSCAEVFCSQGCTVALLDINEDALKTARAKLEKHGDRILCIKADVTSNKDLDKAFRKYQTALADLEILINCAGGGRTTAFFDISIEEWNAILNLNLTSIFSISQIAAKIFKKKSRGSIVNVSSVAGRSVSLTAGCHYTSSKAGLLGLTRHMAATLAPHNIRVNAVCPGATNSDRIYKRLVEQGRLEQVEKSIPLGRLGDMSEVAAACLFLASDLSSYMTGATLDVNGGVLMI